MDTAGMTPPFGPDQKRTIKPSLGGGKMLGSIGIAEIRIFLGLVWTAALSSVATVVLYKLHFKAAFTIIASLGLASLALAAWAYLSIWGFVWLR